MNVIIRSSGHHWRGWAALLTQRPISTPALRSGEDWWVDT